MLARFTSPCPECGELIEEGTEIIRQASGDWVHRTCPDGPIDDPRPICDKCFLVKPCFCE